MEKPGDVLFFKDAIFGVLGQLVFVQVQLMMIVGLCLDGGRSWTGKFYNTKIMQFLGRISMSLYLVHEPIIYYINLVDYGGPIVDQWKDGKQPDGYSMVPWAIPIHIIISILAGTVLTLFIEEPARKYLKKKLL